MRRSSPCSASIDPTRLPPRGRSGYRLGKVTIGCAAWVVLEWTPDGGCRVTALALCAPPVEMGPLHPWCEEQVDDRHEKAEEDVNQARERDTLGSRLVGHEHPGHEEADAGDQHQHP